MMKTFKKGFSVLLLVFLCSSCDDLVDKIVGEGCDIAIEEVEDRFQDEIYQLQENSDLTEEEKDELIKELQEELEDEIEELKEDCEEGVLG